MKKILFSLLTLFYCFSTLAQVDKGINYQALISNTEGKALKNQPVSIRLNILENSANGNSVYEEIHEVNTNDYGLINLVIGRGSSNSDFKSISWTSTNKFVRVEYKINNNSYVLLGTSELLSVPYAIVADHAKNVNFSEELQGKIKSMIANDEIFKGELLAFILSKDEINSYIIQVITNSAEIQEQIINYILNNEEINNHIIQLIANSEELKQAFKDDFINSEDFKNQVKEYLLTDIGYFSPGTNQVICGINETVQLNASPLAEGEKGGWSVSPAEGSSFSDINDPKSTFQVARAGTYILTWNVKNGNQEKSGNFTIDVQDANLSAEIHTSEITGPGNANIQAEVSSSVSSVWSIIEGTGGSLSTHYGNSTSLTGIEGNLYKIVFEASNHCTSVSDTIEIYFANGESMLDPKDGQPYKTVKIGNQVWMMENYNYASSGSSVHPNVPSGEEKKYGRLYTLEDAQNLAPAGWRLPTSEDYIALMNNYYDCNDPSFCGNDWENSDILFEGGNSGFEAITGGQFNPVQNEYYQFGTAGFYWANTESSLETGKFHILYFNRVDRMVVIGDSYVMDKDHGVSIRFIKE